MHKVVLEVGGEADLVKVAEKLKEASVDHKLWVEQPENFPTCLAVKPYPKEVTVPCSICVFKVIFCSKCKNISRNSSFTKDQKL